MAFKYFRSFLLIVVFTSLAFSCKKEEPHLSQETMRSILTDIQLAETYSTMVLKDSTHPVIDKNMDSLALFYKEIFRHYNVTQEEFQSSIKWYQLHPDEIDSVYARMLGDFNKMEGSNPTK
ncbi:DUF4296 domain-containing protein [Taibaiella soli]|uniref:DUF4296 domain-containing protein n=1 Tax=Taibaiella soli TaxID=1649169 RepID=A0A2W2ACU4_9BACT|nr:DUF4296 domain-containing protein [Taibaiella soli]PZF71442.1 hypothetical protein DN068_19330 [Taibaiella soli]